MKKRFMLAIMSLVLASSVTLTSCFGEFVLVRKAYNLNDTLVENKFVKSLLFYVFGATVYPLAGLIDSLVLNLIEFWTGSNPMAMNEGEYEMQTIVHNDVTYEIEATKNQFIITPLEGEKAFQSEYLRYDDELTRWSYVDANNSTTPLVGQINTEEGSIIELFTKNGSVYINEEDVQNIDLHALIVEEGCK